MPDNNAERGMPQSVEAERALLGSILLDNTALYRAMELLKPDDFFSTGNRITFEMMVSISEKNRIVDLVTLSEELSKNGLIEKAGGGGYLAQLTDGVPLGTTAGVAEYCRIVKEKSTKRRLINVSNNILVRCLEDTDDADSLIEIAQTEVFDLAAQRTDAGLLSARQIFSERIGSIEKLFERGSVLTGIPTGLVDLDDLTCGLQPKELIVIAGRTSEGKTALGLQIAAHAAIQGKKAVGIFSLEMASEALLTRLICAEGRIDSHKLRTGFTSRDDWGRALEAIRKIQESNLYIDDDGAQTVMQIRAKARRHKAEKGLDLLVVDYLQLVSAGKKSENRTQEVSYISKSLKAIAKELKIPVLALCQLKRPADQRPNSNRRPQLTDLRESGSIEQDSDVVVLIFRPKRVRKDDGDDESSDPNDTFLILGKQRNGPTGDVPVVFLKPYGIFANAARETLYDPPPDSNIPFDT